MSERAMRWVWMGGSAAIVLVVALAVWQFWPKVPVAPSPAAAPVDSVPAVMYGPHALPRWAWDEIPWRSVRFTPPTGHWVYYAAAKREFWVIPGAPLHEGADAPDEQVLSSAAVAVLTEVYFDKDTFKDWQDLEYTLASFFCARGTSEADYVTCDPTPSGEVRGTNPFGLPLHSFRYPKVSHQTNQRVGTATFTVVRFEPEGSFGLLLHAVDEARGQAPIRTIAQSLERS